MKSKHFFLNLVIYFAFAYILNEQYDSVFTLEDPVLPKLLDSPYSDMPNIHIDNNGAIKLLSRLNPSKAKGPDLLPTRVLKKAETEIAPYRCFIFQQSNNTGEVPQDMEAWQCYSNI